jgi:tetratricopeptide (TPR) repeat protein
MTTDAVDRGTAQSGNGSERWYLNDEREFLLRSIDDAEREHSAGDLSDADYQVLVRRDGARLAEVEAELAALGPEVPIAASASPEATPRRRYGKWSRVGIVAACLLIATGAIILVDHAVSPAAPGQASSGTVTLPKAELIEQQLDAAAILSDDGEGGQALELYEKVLAEDPDDPDALAASGWLEWNAGRAARAATLVRAGRQAETKAVHVAPHFFGGHLYLGLIMLEQDHNAVGAVEQFTSFLADSPTAAEVASFAPQMIPAYTQTHKPLPAQIAATTAATTTTTTTTTSAP